MLITIVLDCGPKSSNPKSVAGVTRKRGANCVLKDEGRPYFICIDSEFEYVSLHSTAKCLAQLYPMQFEEYVMFP